MTAGMQAAAAVNPASGAARSQTAAAAMQPGTNRRLPAWPPSGGQDYQRRQARPQDLRLPCFSAHALLLTLHQSCSANADDACSLTQAPARPAPWRLCKSTPGTQVHAAMALSGSWHSFHPCRPRQSPRCMHFTEKTGLPGLLHAPRVAMSTFVSLTLRTRVAAMRPDQNSPVSRVASWAMPAHLGCKVHDCVNLLCLQDIAEEVTAL